MWKRTTIALLAVSALLVVCTHATVSPPPLARANSAPNLGATNATPPPLRRTKSSPALLLGFSSIKVLKKEPDPKAPNKFKVTLSAKVGAQSSKSLLEVNSLRSQRGGGALQLFRRRKPIPLMMWAAAGAVSFFIGYKIVKAPRPKGRAQFRMRSSVASSSSSSEPATEYPSVPKVQKDTTGAIVIKGTASPQYRTNLENVGRELDRRIEALPAFAKHFFNEMDNFPEVTTEQAAKIIQEGPASTIKAAAEQLKTWARDTDTRIASMSGLEKALFTSMDPFPEISTERATSELLTEVTKFINKAMDDKSLREAVMDGLRQVDAMSRMSETLGGTFESGSGSSDDDRPASSSSSSNTVTATVSAVESGSSEPASISSIPDPSEGIFGTSDQFS